MTKEDGGCAASTSAFVSFTTDVPLLETRVFGVSGLWIKGLLDFLREKCSH